MATPATEYERKKLSVIIISRNPIRSKKKKTIKETPNHKLPQQSCKLPTSHVRPVEIIRRTRAANRATEPISEARRKSLACLLRRADLFLQLRRALVNELELREVRVEDAHDLGNLFLLVMCSTKSLIF